MKKTYILSIIAITFSGFTMFSCDYLNNPLVDNNGEKINLVRLDLPKFDARYTIRLVSATGELLDDATAPLNFTGKDANNLITDAGRIVMKEQSDKYIGYRTAKFGMLNVNLSPNFKVASHPVSFQVSGATSPLNEYVIMPKIITQTVAGDLNTDITAIKLSPQRRQRAVAIDNQTVIINGGRMTKICDLNTHNGNGYAFLALYSSAESAQATFTCTDNSAQYDNYGIYLLNESMEIAPTQSKVIDAGAYFIIAVKPKSTIQGKIKMEINSVLKGVAVSLPYTITSEAGTVIRSGTVSGTLPFSATIEQIFVPTTASKVNIKLEGTTTYTIAPEATQKLDISSSSTPSISFTVATDGKLKADIRRCDISVVGICNTNKQIAFYPTIRFQYSLKDTKQWEWAESKGGKIVMMLEQDRDYSIRIPINNVWQTFTITTNRAKIEAMVRDQPNVSKFELINKEDGTMILKVEYKDQEFCDLSL